MVIQSEVARDSTVAANLANKRHAVLYAPSPGGDPPLLATYRRREDELPSKTWPMTGAASLGAVERRATRLRARGTSTLYAVAVRERHPRCLGGGGGGSSGGVRLCAECVVAEDAIASASASLPLHLRPAPPSWAPTRALTPRPCAPHPPPGGRLHRDGHVLLHDQFWL